MKFAKCLAVLALASALCGTVSVAVASPTLVLSGNKLVGAKNVLVDNKAYDVTFADGTCASLFSGCVNSAFAFSTYAQADAASRALSDQVFKNVAAGNFDRYPELTAGCFLGSGCIVLTPYKTELGHAFYASVDNTSGTGFISGSRDGFYVSNAGYDTSGQIDKTYAVWRVSPTPEPQTYAMLLAGLGLIGAAVKRRKSVAR